MKINSIIFFLISIISELTPDYQFLIRYCALAAAAMCSQLYLTKTVVMVELYPTAIRNIANSFMGLLSRFGNTLAPQIFYLVSKYSIFPIFFKAEIYLEKNSTIKKIITLINASSLSIRLSNHWFVRFLSQ